jgi:putative transposase
MQATRRRRQGAQAWRGVLARFTASGLTALAFCEREGISRASLYRWRSLLGSASVEPRAPSVTNTAADFVDLGTLSPPSSRLELRLDLGGGVLLQLTRS